MREEAKTTTFQQSGHRYQNVAWLHYDTSR